MTDPADHPIILQDGSEFPRSLATEKLRRTSSARDTLIEEHSAAFRWLMASFLALNGGGLVAVAGAELPNDAFIGAGICFWIGVMSALGLAWRSQVINRKGIQRLEEIERVWATAVGLNKLDSLEAQKAEEGMKVSSLSARVCGWTSVAAWSLGVWIAGAGLL